MASITALVDDFDNDISEDVQTVRYGWGDKTFEIDLGTDNRVEFEKTLADYINVSREVQSARTASGAKRTRALTRRNSDGDAAKIREWAQAAGIEVTTRGRISAEVREAYEKAHPAA